MVPLLSIFLVAALPQRQALWVYPDKSASANTMTDPKARRKLVEKSAASGVTDLYVSVYQPKPNIAGRQMYADRDIEDLIRRAHRKHIRVWASYGNPDWPSTGCATTGTPLRNMAAVVAFDKAHRRSRFDGVVLDIEPADPQTNAQYRALLTAYRCIQASLPRAGRDRLELAIAIRFAWTQLVSFPAGGATKSVYQHVIDMNPASVIVMGYRNTAGADCAGSAADGMICLDQPMITYASSTRQSGVILAGIETSNCAPGCGPAKITFFSNGQAEMNRQAAIVAKSFATEAGFGGFAIYSYEGSYLGGVFAGWPPVNTEFPVVSRFSGKR